MSKQPTLIELSDIHQVVFSRLGTSIGANAARTFDMKIVTKVGSDLMFTSVNKEEHEVVSSYLQDKKVKTKNEMMEGELPIALDDEDEEMQSVASSGEEAPKPRRGDDDDDSEEGWCPRLSDALDALDADVVVIVQTRTSRPRTRTRAHRQSQTPTRMVARPRRTRVAIVTS